jgi:senataxin
LRRGGRHGHGGGDRPAGLKGDSRFNLEVSFVDEAHIVCTTLSSTGLELFEAAVGFDVLIVDEAAQSVELSTLVPLRLGIRQAVLVGDPQQLPATVFSRGGARSGYDVSLFERLTRAPTRLVAHMLDTQYRMHPAISAFPSRYFYQGRLRDGGCVGGGAWRQSWHEVAAGGPLAPPLLFCDLATSAERGGGRQSRANEPEAQLVVALYQTLCRTFPDEQLAARRRVGVITPYAQQLSLLKRLFERALGPRWAAEVDVNTVDGFQGREKDIILFSCVRSAGNAGGGGAGGGIGFLDDLRRMNVALTRARHSLFVVGRCVLPRAACSLAACLLLLLLHCRRRRRRRCRWQRSDDYSTRRDA